MSDFRKPDFKITEDGTPIPDDVVAAVIQITVDDVLDGAAVATVRLRDEGAALSSGSHFSIGAELVIELGYVGDTSQVFVGEVTGWKGGFPRRGNPTLTVVAQDRFHRLRRNRRRKTFLEMKDSDAIAEVASAAGLSPKVTATPVQQHSIIQWNQSDADFVLERAGLFDLEVFVDGKTLVVREPALDAASVAKIRWHEELHNFTTAASLARQHKQLKVSAWDMTRKQRVEAVVAKGKERSLMGGVRPGAEAVAPVDGDPHWLSTTPAAAQTEVDAYAEAWFRKRAERYLTGEGLCEGDPEIQRGTVIELEGLGELLSGPYYARRVIHTLLPGSGYTTAFHVIRTAVLKPAQVPPKRQESQPAPRPEPEALLDPDWEGELNPDGTLEESVEATFEPKVVEAQAKGEARGAGIDASVE